MDKLKEISTNLSHSFSVSERKNIIITGVVKIDSFDKEEFLVETVQGIMNIKGDNLEVVKLDTYQGNITIKGRIDSITYIEDNIKKESSLFNKLFKWVYLFNLKWFLLHLFMYYFFTFHLKKKKKY